MNTWHVARRYYHCDLVNKLSKQYILQLSLKGKKYNSTEGPIKRNKLRHFISASKVLVSMFD